MVVTTSNDSTGARLEVWSEQGQRLATSPSIGMGNRWRDLLMAAPFGPQDEMEMVDVLTPHIGGVVEYFRWDQNRLVQQTARSGYSTHTIGSRNLGMATAGYFNNDDSLVL